MLRDFMLWEVGRYEREINLSAMKYARRAHSVSFILMRNRFAQSSRREARFLRRIARYALRLDQNPLPPSCDLLHIFFHPLLRPE